MLQTIAMGTTRITAEQLQCAKLQKLLVLWDEFRQGRVQPQRRDFVPEQLGFILGRVSLVEVLPAERNFRFRLVGTQIEDAGRRGDQGRTLDRIELRSYGQMLTEAYRDVLQDAQPVCCRVEYRNREADIWFEHLVLPFATEGDDVELLLDAIDWPLGMIQNFRNLAHVEQQRRAG